MIKGFNAAFFASSLILIGGALISESVWSMDEMTDGQLASATGQDGVTIIINPKNTSGGGLNPTNAIGLTAINTVHKTFVSGTANANGSCTSCVYTAGVLRSDITGIQFEARSGGLVDPLQIRIDTTGNSQIAGPSTNSANPMVLANFTMPNVGTIRAFFKDNGQAGAMSAGKILSSAPVALDFSTGGFTTNTGAATKYESTQLNGVAAASYVPMISVGGTSTTDEQLKIVLASDLSIGFAVGNVGTTTGFTHFVNFTSLNFTSIDFNGAALNIESPNVAAGTGGYGASASRLSFKPSITNLNLSGMYAGVTPAGLVVQGPASVSGVGVVLADVTAGTLGATTATLASGLKNASMGTFGAIGMSMTNLKFTVSGM